MNYTKKDNMEANRTREEIKRLAKDRINVLTLLLSNETNEAKKADLLVIIKAYQKVANRSQLTKACEEFREFTNNWRKK